MNQSETSVDEFPISDALVQQLHTLACTPFELAAFRQKWQEFGWPQASDSTDDFYCDNYYCYARALGPRALQVSLDEGAMACAWLSFCYWQRYDTSDHDSDRGHRAERREYDAVYDRAVEHVGRVLGPPALVGHDPPMRREVKQYRYAVWPGETALLILQQCGFELLAGIEIMFWLEPCPLEEFRPEPTLIGWLEERHWSSEEEASASAV